MICVCGAGLATSTETKEVAATYGGRIGVWEIAERVYPHPGLDEKPKKMSAHAVGMACNLSRENKTKPKSTWVTLPRYGGNENYGRMAKLADALDLGSNIERC